MDAASLRNKVAYSLYFDIDDDEESIYLITIGLCVLNLNSTHLPRYIYIYMSIPEHYQEHGCT